MKIRTDFVTNSSSSSFVTYRITPGENKEAFMQLRILLERLCSKYEQYYVPNTYDGGEALRAGIRVPSEISGTSMIFSTPVSRSM